MDCRVEDDGIWDRHAELRLSSDSRFEIVLQPGALGSLNGQPFASAALRNGDVLAVGAAKIQFWLSAAPLRDWRWRERAFWLAMGGLTLLQLALMRLLA